MDEYTVERLTEDTYELAEGPLWHEDANEVTWVDIPAGRMWTASWPRTGSGQLAPRLTHQADGPLGAALPCADGGWLFAVGTAIEHHHPDGTSTTVSVPAVDVEGQPTLRLNDAACDPAGRLLAGTMTREPFGGGALYQLSGGRLRRLLSGVGISNGLGWSPDGALFYYADSITGRVDQFDYDVATGDLSGRRPLVELRGGSPDGLCVDAEGAVWVAVWGASEVRRILATGEHVATVALPTPQASSCAFVGERRRDLLITTGAEDLTAQQRAEQPDAGAVYVVRDLPVKGLPRNLFAG